MFRPEPLDLVLIAIAAMLLFGANRLPESMRAIGKAIREFRRAVTEDEPADPTRPGPDRESHDK
ncbi:MAG: twin-arginine translocase TatA/TatE family subunit [Chloroflexi bacterium]|nr:twin-arginine translocase TatA/TatE family subunit [Chloroflexota bacterium]